MKPGKLYLLTGNNQWWVVVYRKSLRLTGYFSVDIVVQLKEACFNDRWVYGEGVQYRNRTFGNFLKKGAVEIEVKDLPLYVSNYTSPVFAELLSGEYKID